MSALDAAVWVDGARVASTAPEFYAGETAVLSGLQVTWGRRTVVDQPDADSASFQVVQRAGRADFLLQLTTGADVEIHASGWVYPPAPGTPAFTDPGYESAAVGAAPAAISHNITGRVVAPASAHSGAHALRLVPGDPAAGGSILLAPAPFDSAPDAWDDLPRTDEGQIWEIGIWARANPGAAIRVGPVLFRSPTGSGHILPPEAVSGTGTGAWEWYGVSFTPPPGYFVGVGVEISGWGPTWEAAPGTWAEQSGTWAERAEAHLDDAAVLSPAAGVLRDVLVFSGRITDLTASYDPLSGGSMTVSCTARSFPADLANVRIGDVPWPVQSIRARVDRILALSGRGITARISTTLEPVLVTARDVDAQPAHGLIRELAASVAGIAWSATHATTGPYYWIEDPTVRASLQVLVESGGVVVIIPNPEITDSVSLGAGNILRAPLRWIQDVTDLTTRADVTWQEQGVDDAGKLALTERHVLLINEQLETRHGTLGISLSTQLQAAADALTVAEALLARLGDPGAWRLEGVEWNTAYEQTVNPDELLAALNLLDGTTRIGRALAITDLPAWAPGHPHPLASYLEGGTYAYEEGSWRLSLTVSRAGAGMGDSAAWAELDPTWAWADFAPSITWQSLYGVAGPSPARQIDPPPKESTP